MTDNTGNSFSYNNEILKENIQIRLYRYANNTYNSNNIFAAYRTVNTHPRRAIFPDHPFVEKRSL